MLQLPGDVGNRDAIIEDLEAEVESLKAQLARERQAGREGARAVAALRKTLTPFYQSLQMLFGQMEAVADDEHVSGASVSPNIDARTKAVWDSWKSKLGSTSKVIDALLLHGEMNTQQLSITTGFHRTTIPSHIFKLNKNGLINKNGGKFSLKSL